MISAEIKTTKKANVLYVDDSVMNLTLFQASFESDFDIFLAEDGEKGLEIMRNNEIAVIISDQRMPGMSGTELLEIVAREFPDTLRFILTAFTDYNTVVESVNRGQIYGFFNKPFEADNVRQSLKRALEVYDLRIEKNLFLEELEKANLELRAMDRSRTEFLNAITRELRVPLQKITSALHMLKNKAGSADLAELINFLDNSVSKLENFTLSTNQLVELRSENFNFQAELIPLREIIEIAVIDLNNKVSARGISMKIEEGESGISARISEVYFMNALAIIIEKMAEMIQDEGELLFRTARNENAAILELVFSGNYPVKKLNEWTEFFAKPDLLHYESHIQQILILEILQAHNSGLTLIQEEGGKFIYRITFHEMAGIQS